MGATGCADQPSTEPATAESDPGLWPPALASHIMVYHDSLERVVVFGGSRGDRTMSDTLWSWDGDRWRVESASGPPARIHAGVAYDRFRNRLVVQGGIGSDGQTLGDLWEWDGATWLERAPVLPAPGRRDHHAMVYSSTMGTIILFGGQDEEDRFVEGTWLWDGDSWRELAGVSPPPRGTHRLVVDTRSNAVVLVGGWGSETQLNDLWELRDFEWTPFDEPGLGVPGPGPRGAHRVAYDRARDELVLFGGLEGETLAGDTWTRVSLPIGWRRTDAAGPPPRNVHGMAYDSRRERVVLYGGIGEDGRMGDLWEWDGGEWITHSDPASATGPADAATSLTIQGPTVIAFWEPQSNAALEADSDLAAGLDQQQFYWSQTRSPLGDIGIVAHDHPGLRLRMAHPSGNLSFVAHRDSTRFGYLFVTATGECAVVYRVRTPEELVTAARSFFGLDAEARGEPAPLGEVECPSPG